MAAPARSSQRGLPRILAGTSIVIFAGLAVFQLALVVGAPLGRAAWGGNHEVLPVALRIGSTVSIVIYGVAVAVIHARRRDAESRFGRVGSWVFGVFFLLGVVMNLASSSPWERFLMAPIACVLSATFLVLARSRHEARGQARPSTAQERLIS